MPTDPSKPPPSAERIEQMQRRRTRLMFIQAIFFLLWQTTFFSMRMPAHLRAVDHVKISAYIVWVIVLLAFLATGGGFRYSRQERAILDDETTVAHRHQAVQLGFWAAMAAALGCYVVTLFDTVTAAEVIHAVLTAGVATSLLNFAILERRAARG